MSNHDLVGGGQNSLVNVPLLPLRDIIVFPGTVVPLFVGREKSIQALEHAIAGSKEIILVAQKKAKTNDPEVEDIYPVGTLSTILQLLRLPDGTVKILVEGQKRARILNYVPSERFFMVEAEVLSEAVQPSVENEALIRTVKMSFDNYVRLNKRVPPEMLLSVAQIESESKLSDTLVVHLPNLKLEDKQRLIEEIDPRKRLETIYGYIQSEIEIIRVEKKIRARVKRQMEKTQKEYYLNEQMAAIQKELGEKDDGRAEIHEMEDQIAKRALSEEAREKLTREVKKLKQMSPMSAEATVVRNYIETVLYLPWGEYTKDINDIVFAEAILNRDHFGLEKVKERILEFLAVRQMSEHIKSPILCLIGPPGVGKTSLARSIAESLGRKFVRLSLGGVRDHAEIRGHRKTYIGSMPGRIIMSIKKAGSANPLLLLDEVDKLGTDYRGDPAAALLEVLDPEQNSRFNDHYLDVDFDLSKTLFVATANSYDGIPAPLLDRMECINLAGYTENEKYEIATRYLIPKQIKENGLEGQEVSFQQKAVLDLIRYYTREAGVRNLERELASVFRKLTRKNIQIVEKEQRKKLGLKDNLEAARNQDGTLKGPETIVFDKAQLHIKEQLTPKTLEQYLGPHRYRYGKQGEKKEIGICTGLGWTPTGGDLLFTEVTILPGNGKLTTTGKLGEVMQESAQAALSYIRSRATFLGLEENFYQKIDIHIHVPEGSIPKDGPSAGLCIATALASALTLRPVNHEVAMTGEITLRGRALPVGGLKEKFLAAHRAGIKKILFPKENTKDMHEIPKSVIQEIQFIPVEHMDEVLLHALVWSEQKSQDDLYQRLSKTTPLPKPFVYTDVTTH
jgi:ATP-dependent Lon protease